MIKVNSRGTRSLSTGKNVNGAADTFVETGPKDELAPVDAYAGSLPNDRPAGGPGGGSAQATASEGGSSIAERLNGSNGTSERVTATLWEALLCGTLDPNDESSGNRRARMNRMALWMRSTGCGAENLVGLLAMEGGKAGINREELRRRLDASLDNSIAVLDEEERDNLINALAETTGSDPGVIRASMNAGADYSERPASDREKTEQFSELLGQYTGVNDAVQILDLHAEMAILDSLVGKSIALGLPQAYDQILAQIDDDALKTRVALRSLRQAAVLSDLETVRKTVDRTGSSRALAEVPDLTNLILQFYTWGQGTTTDQYPQKQQELVETLDMINPNWARRKRDGVWVDNLEPFTVASNQAGILLRESPYAAQAMIAQPYGTTDYQSVARKYHPWALDFSA